MHTGIRPDFEYDSSKLVLTCRSCHNTVLAVAVTNVPEVQYGDSEAWLIAECPQCNEKVFVIYDTLNHHVGRTFPFGYIKATDYSDDIPENIRTDLAEAELCRRAQAYRASVVMYRRVVENIAKKELGQKMITDENADDLKKKIILMFKKGLITKPIEQQAQEIRLFGNYGAHPADDGLDLQIGKEDVELIDDLVWDIIRTIYVQPAKHRKLQSKRTEELK
jgi:hypothetical protein